MRMIVFSMIFISSFLAGCICDGREQNEISLEHGVVYDCERIRTWKSFDTMVPSEKSVQHWVSGGYNVMNCASFAPYEGDQTEKAAGRFWELLLWFENKGEQESTVWIHTEDRKGLDAYLIVAGKKKIPVKAFLIPGLNIAPVSLAVSWEGKLGFDLLPGEKTWLLLVFDVPEKYNSAHFRLKESSKLFISLPDTDRREYNDKD
jgi:hypothetical protein